MQIKTVSHSSGLLSFRDYKIISKIWEKDNEGRILSGRRSLYRLAMSLIVSLLIRYPVATLKLNPEDFSLIFSLIFRYKFSTEEELSGRIKNELGNAGCFGSSRAPIDRG